MDYGALVHRVRELVWEHVPAGSSVAVVSKGDPALILFDQRHGLHYPQSGNGNYLGHHPDTGAAAVAHLETVRLRGAQYFVIPSIYAWFLDYYTDLRAHLRQQGELIHSDDVCAIYSLTGLDRGSTLPSKTAPQRQLRDLVAAVLPPGSKIVALGWSHQALAGSADFELVDVPASEGPETLHRLDGAEYMVVPATPSGQTRSADPLAERAHAAWTTVLDQRHVCAIYAIPAARAHRK